MNRENFETILRRLVDFSRTPRGEIEFCYAQTELSDYDNLILNSNFTKPTLQEFETELAVYEEELFQAAEAARIEAEARQAELDRLAALRARWEAIKHLRDCAKVFGVDQPNMKVFIDERLEEVELLEQIEAQDILEIEKKAIKQAEDDAKDILKAELKTKVKDKSAKLEDVIEILNLMEW